MRTFLAVTFLATAIAGFGFGYAAHPAPAQADKTITLLSAGATWDSMTFRPAGGGAVFAEVCAHTTLQGGGTSAATCTVITLPAANPVATQVTALGNGAAVNLWKTDNGL
jgi:hypothetical protein